MSTKKEVLQVIRALQPKFYKDGNAWCFRYGTDIVSGVCGFGETPYEAAADFYNNFMWGKTESDAPIPPIILGSPR